MLFPSFLYNLDRDRKRDALHAAMPYRPEHFVILGHVAVSYRGRTQHSAMQLKPGYTPLAPGTRVAEVDFGFEMDPAKIIINRLGRVVSGKVRESKVLWATGYKYDQPPEGEKVTVTRHDPPKEGESANLWLAVLSRDCPVEEATKLADFGPVPPPPPPKKRKSRGQVGGKEPKGKKARKE